MVFIQTQVKLPLDMKVLIVAGVTWRPHFGLSGVSCPKHNNVTCESD